MPGADPVAVIGMGAVGTLLPGALAAAGHPILACGRAAHLDPALPPPAVPATWSPGPISPAPCAASGGRYSPPRSTTPPPRAGWLAAPSPGQCLLAAQNGVSHRESLTPLTRAAVVPVLVYVNAERTGRGCVRARITGRGLVMP